MSARMKTRAPRQRGGRSLPCLGTIGSHWLVMMIGDAAFGGQVRPTGLLIGDARVSTLGQNQPLYSSWVIVSLR